MENLITELLTSAAFATFIATLLTMFIDDEKIKKAGPLARAVLTLLNGIAGNVFKNKNK